MSKSLSVASMIEKNRLSSEVAFLVALNIDVINPVDGTLVSTGRYVRNAEAVTINGFDYVPASFDIELKAESGTQQSIRLTFNDYTRVVQQQMQLYGGGVGFQVTVGIVNSAMLDSPPEVVEFFEVIAAESSAYVVSFTLGAENVITKAFPRRRQTRDFCQSRYKSVECGYSGDMATCDLTLRGTNGCAAHGNAIRFGAFPGINTQNVRYG